eukprot:CAMPEP_0201282478 /NCGR_PEP_ID=MMETSP1317-20130820/5749_1 /ASSEMBLY_ACC=CAM_ASM_000770 /TAXON_ID=187299 /ORGANISM="Undescribed Undescribed, Strain Undescribed" /LENGTH=42 /DNA_ID= /DNA_START= /DNA_END= /DNA_ORIENTATION=
MPEEIRQLLSGDSQLAEEFSKVDVQFASKLGDIHQEVYEMLD